MKHTEIFLTRKLLSVRWHCSMRKVDRLRELGILAWIDLSGGKGSRPTVRFHIDMIEEFEKRNLKKI